MLDVTPYNYGLDEGKRRRTRESVFYLCYNNLAVQYRNQEKPRSFKINLLKAMEVWKESGSEYDQALTGGLLARAHQMLDETSKSENAKQMAISIMDTLQDNPFRLSWGHIHLADAARSIGNLKWEIETLSKGLDHAEKYVDQAFFDYINGRLLAISMGRNPFDLENIGLLNRPSMTPWQKIGDSFHPVTPSKDSPTA